MILKTYACFVWSFWIENQSFAYSLKSVCFVSWQILHSTGLEFQHQVQEAKDLDQLIKIHYRYLATIHDRCLLREKVNSSAFPQLKLPSNLAVEAGAKEKSLLLGISKLIHITHLWNHFIKSSCSVIVYPVQTEAGGQGELPTCIHGTSCNQCWSMLLCFLRSVLWRRQ